MTTMGALLYAAKVTGVGAQLLVSVCLVESNLIYTINPKDGRSASYGVCHVKTATARQFDRGATPVLLMSPIYNSIIAARYLKWQLERYKTTTCAIAAYNAGSCKFNDKGRLINEHYIRKVRRASLKARALIASEPFKDI